MAGKKNTSYRIGVDIGGSKMAAVLFDGSRVLADSSLATPKDNLDHLLVMLKALVQPLEEKVRTEQKRLIGVGIGVPAVLSSDGEKITWAPNLPILDEVAFRALAEQTPAYPVRLGNDADCFTRAEALSGAGQRYDSVYGLTIGTGIGGGWWVNGGNYRGKAGGGNEPGHVMVNYSEEMDLEQAYQKLTQGNAAQLAEEAFRGDVLADQVFRELGRLFGVALANIANIIAPDIFVLGGGVVESGELFLATTKKTLLSQIVSVEYRKQVKIAKSKLGKQAGAVGAALLFSSGEDEKNAG